MGLGRGYFIFCLGFIFCCRVLRGVACVCVYECIRGCRYSFLSLCKFCVFVCVCFWKCVCEYVSVVV